MVERRDNLFGYQHPLYAESLSEFGRPRKLPLSGGWLLERSIAGTDYNDALGCYPLFTCSDWSKLEVDLEALRSEWLSVSLVADPFGDYEVEQLQRSFGVVLHFKDRFVVDCTTPLPNGSKRHRYYARRAFRSVKVETCPEPWLHLDEWTELYAQLVRKRCITGIRAFSRDAFAMQLRIPGLVMFRAVSGSATLGMDLWYVNGDVAYGHLAAYSVEGAALQASYAVKSYLIDYFRSRVRWIDLGAGTSFNEEADTDGLAQFKRGWANRTLPTFFCGRINDPDRYEQLTRTRRSRPGLFFPAYRTEGFD
jgi:hypothetical protein